MEVRADNLERAGALLGEAGFTRIERGDDGLRVFDGDHRAPEIARLLVRAGLALDALVPGRESLESDFLRLTGGGA